MIRRTAIAGACFTGAALFLGGCADFMQRSAVAPDWFNAKVEEVKGTGYPELQDVPTLRGGSAADQAEWDAAAASLEAEKAKIDARLAEVDKIIAEEGLNPTDEGARATAAQLRATTEKGSAAPEGQP
jgi:hypothetical protein